MDSLSNYIRTRTLFRTTQSRTWEPQNNWDTHTQDKKVCNAVDFTNALTLHIVTFFLNYFFISTSTWRGNRTATIVTSHIHFFKYPRIFKLLLFCVVTGGILNWIRLEYVYFQLELAGSVTKCCRKGSWQGRRPVFTWQVGLTQDWQTASVSNRGSLSNLNQPCYRRFYSRMFE